MISGGRSPFALCWCMNMVLGCISPAQVQDTCKKWSQGGRLAVAGAPGDFTDDPPARSAGDLTLNLADAEVGGRSEHLDLGDDALRCCRPAKMLAPRLGGSHAGGHTLAYER